jgi:shikimate dehydrogenase
MTDRYFVLGHPVAHSQSPFIHTEFARLTGEDIDYGRLLCP